MYDVYVNEISATGDSLLNALQARYVHFVPCTERHCSLYDPYLKTRYIAEEAALCELRF
jgi:hypothetical protein